MRAPAPHRRPEGGFSLVELLVVITIIGILATMVTVKVIGAMSEARRVKARAEISEMKKAIGIYSIYKHGRIPEELADLEKPAKDGDDEGIMDIPPKDPWGNPYEYEKLSSRKYIIRSLGADRSPGGEGEDADIDSDNLTEDAANDGGARQE